MNIREALAAQGNEPLVFMGGTCSGPKWRERLCSQIKREYRWFNPVVDEWTESAQETERVVREEAAILLYVITPYQEGCYSFLELTEDAIKSPARTVVTFIPSYEDKAFSESQWSSIVQAKRLLERNQARVCFSMEELIDYLNAYCPENAHNNMLSAQSLSQYQARTPSTLQPESKLASLVENVKAEDMTPPTPEEPGTVTATALLGQVTNEGIIDTITSLFGKKPKHKPSTPPKPKVEPRRHLDILATAKKLSDVEFVRENWDGSRVSGHNWRGLSKSAKTIDQTSDVVSGIKEQAKRIDEIFKRLDTYHDHIVAVDHPLSRRVVAGEISGDALQQEIIKQYSPLKLPYGKGATFKTVFGDTEYRFDENKEESKWVMREGPTVHASDVTPERVAAYCAGFVSAYGAYQEMCDRAYDIPLITLDASDQPFRAVFMDEAVTVSDKLNALCEYLCDFEGSPSSTLYDMVEAYVGTSVDIIDGVVTAANAVTHEAGASFESLSSSSEGIIDDVVRFMKGHSTKAPEEGTNQSEHKWITQEADTIKKTLGNPAWVKTNYHSAIRLAESTLQQLRVGGEVVKPDIGLREGLKTLTHWLDSEAKAVRQYDTQMTAILTEAQTRYDNGVSPEEIRYYLLVEGRKLKIPRRSSPGPWMPGDVRLIFKGDDVTPETKPASQKLDAPELSIDDVTDAGREIATFVDRYLSLIDEIPFAGSGCDVGFWTSEDFDYDISGMEDIYTMYYFQSDPDEANVGFHEMLWLYINYIRTVGVWLKAYTR